MDVLAATDLTFSQMKVMFVLGAHEETLPVNEIADRVHLSLAATGRTVDKLVGLELVDRREDPADRRVKLISLTDAGVEFVQSHLTVRDELVHQFVSGLPETLRQGLTAALRPIVDSEVDHFDLSPIPETPVTTTPNESRPSGVTPDRKVTV